MNERYLFKAKRIDNGEWVQGNILLDIEKNKPSETYRIYPVDHVDICRIVDETTICQCTGLKDKNGKLIWENDILKYEWDRTRIDFIKYQAPIFTYSKTMRWSLQQDEVIGNVFDNPELLEGGE